MKTLFDETCIGTMQLRNRLVRSATWEAMADETGLPTPRLIGVYQDLALGGTGLIISSATTITGDATRIAGMLAIPDDTCIPAYHELTRTVHDAGASVVMQLVLPGRNGVFWTPGDPTCDDIQSIIKAFGDAALRAQRAGFDGVEIHAAHGYFLSQFLNARKNTRTDEYGGTVRNRIRFLLEIMSGIQAKTGESFPILVKINCSDFEEDDGSGMPAARLAGSWQSRGFVRSKYPGVSMVRHSRRRACLTRNRSSGIMQQRLPGPRVSR